MEGDAFKIPLRPNPSTLPNVFATSLNGQSQAFKTGRKAFLLSLFKKASLIWSIHMMSREIDWELLLSRCGQEKDPPLTQLSRVRIKGQLWVWPQLLRLSRVSTGAKPTLNKLVTGIFIMYSSPRAFYLRRYALFGLLSTETVQLGLVRPTGVWIQTE